MKKLHLLYSLVYCISFFSVFNFSFNFGKDREEEQEILEWRKGGKEEREWKGIKLTVFCVFFFSVIIK